MGIDIGGLPGVNDRQELGAGVSAKEKRLMRRWICFAMAMVLIPGAFPAFAWAQAAAEYGIAASKSAAASLKSRALYDARAKQLAERLKPRTSKSPQSVVQENKLRLEEKSREAGGTVRIESVPDKAMVSIDGAVVGYTPTELKVPEGSHLIQLTRPGFVSWRREISVTREENISLRAELEDKYKSSITLSQPK